MSYSKFFKHPSPSNTAGSTFTVSIRLIKPVALQLFKPRTGYVFSLTIRNFILKKLPRTFVFAMICPTASILCPEYVTSLFVQDVMTPPILSATAFGNTLHSAPMSNFTLVLTPRISISSTQCFLLSQFESDRSLVMELMKYWSSSLFSSMALTFFRRNFCFGRAPFTYFYYWLDTSQPNDLRRHI